VHVLPLPHTVPQVPQLRLSVSLFVHVVPTPEGQRSGVAAGHVHFPATQVALDGQCTPHAPQLVMLVDVSMQVPAHFVSPPVHTHVLLTHAVPPVHLFVQPPQLFGSLEVSVHVPGAVPHTVVLGAGHVHADEAQRPPVAQTTPHAPQSLALLDRSTHDPEQFVSVPHPPHDPPLHAEPAPHATPQVPQFEGSLEVFTHTPAHTSGLPAGQVHVPPTHVAEVGHVVPHAPQLFASFVVSTHAPEHDVRPVAHAHTPPVQTIPAPHA